MCVQPVGLMEQGAPPKRGGALTVAELPQWQRLPVGRQVGRESGPDVASLRGITEVPEGRMP
jgi:hypothetical protein